MKLNRLLIAIVLLMLSACASIITVNGACGTQAAANICLGKQAIPKQHTKLFYKASQQVIDTLSTPEFERELKAFIHQYSRGGAHSRAWRFFNMDNIQVALLEKVNGLEIETFGGTKGAYHAFVTGNKAFAGGEKTPILLNRWALPRPSESIAATIAHEATHRVGYTHPHSKDAFKVALCEPPYVIGSIVEKLLLGERFNSKGHCQFLAQSNQG